jgi:hypothetical protein
MTSPLAVLGVQRPRVRSVPPRVEPDEDSPGYLAVELAETAGLYLDEWQRTVLVDALAQKPDGRWAAREVALIVPRQNGKGSVLEALELAALFLPEPNGPPPLVLHSAHEYKTADEHFRRMRDLIDGSDRLRQQVRIVRTASGAQAIELHSGARLRFVTRTSGSGRGFSADLVVMDEAYNLTDEAMAAVLPTLSARPNPQLWYTSSAGMPSSSVLTRVRQRGKSGTDEQLAFFEWSAADDADLDDPLAWAQANPALGIRIDLESVAGERAAMPQEQFARERLGLWADVQARKTAVDPAVWTSLIGPTPPQGRDVAFALDVAPDHSTATVAACWSTPDGMWLQLADHRPGVDWVVARVGELLQRWGGRLLVEQTGTAAFLLPKLTAEGVSRRFFADACSSLDAAVAARSLRHGNQRELNDAVAVARWSSSGEAGQRVLSRKDPRVSPLVAAALALHGLTTNTTSGGWAVFL